MSRIHSAWANKRCSSRKLPPVTRMILVMTSSSRGAPSGKAISAGIQCAPTVGAHFGRAQGAQLVGAPPREWNLSMAVQPSLQPRRSDQHQPKLPAVEEVADLFQAGPAQPVRFVHQQELQRLRDAGVCW